MTFVIEAGQAGEVRLSEESGDLRLIQTANPSAPALVAHRFSFRFPGR